jgi:hypothetical protein
MLKASVVVGSRINRKTQSSGTGIACAQPVKDKERLPDRRRFKTSENLCQQFL